MDEMPEPTVAEESPRVPRSARKGNRSARSKGASMQGCRSAGSRTLQEMQAELLRRTYRGITTHSSNRQSFTGLDSEQKASMPYASTSHYLRQITGYEKAKTSENSSIKTTNRAPAYKTPEEYYDEVIALKKQIQELNLDNSLLKSKLRRAEEDFIKKKREVEQLLDPVKNDEVRRTLAESKPESGMVVHGLKQKILKLEEQLREKESVFSKLQSDLKTTKIDEMKIALEVCYNEIQRLRSAQLSKGSLSPSIVAARKDNPSKVKALTVQLMKSNIDKNRLLSENKSLREDLQRCMEKNGERTKPSVSKEYEDMNKKELLVAVAALEQKLEKVSSESNLTGSDNHQTSPTVEGKLTLEGSTNQRLDQLDKRETELLQQIEHHTTQCKKLKEDRTYYRTKCEEKDEEIKRLKKELDECMKQLSTVDKLSTSSPKSASSKTGNCSRSGSVVDKDQQHKLEEFRRNRAAKRIQSGWLQHHARDVDRDEATEMIQSAIRGHQIRKQNLYRLNRNNSASKFGARGTDDDQEDDSGVDETAEFLQSNIRAHGFRKQQLSRRTPHSSRQNSRSNIRSNSQTDLDDIDGRRNSGRTSHRQMVQSNDNDTDEDIVLPQGHKTRTQFFK